MIAISIKSILNISYFFDNWNTTPIYDISAKPAELNPLFDENFLWASLKFYECDIDFWQGKNLSLLRENYTGYIKYQKFSYNSKGKLCGKDLNGRKIYFDKEENCPINYIEISMNERPKIDLSYYNIIELDNSKKLFFSNTNVNGIVINNLILAYIYPLKKFTSDDYDKADEYYYKDKNYPYTYIDSMDNEIFLNNIEIKRNNKDKVHLYSTGYYGLNEDYSDIDLNILDDIIKKVTGKFYLAFKYTSLISMIIIFIIFIIFLIMMILQYELYPDKYFPYIFIFFFTFISFICQVIFIYVYFYYYKLLKKEIDKISIYFH